MGIFNEEIQRISAFYHALGKVLTEENNSIAGEKYKSAHNVVTKEIWVDSIAYCQDLTEANAEANINDALTQLGTVASPARLYPLKGTNYQSWFLDTGSPTVSLTGCEPSSGWVKPLINPSDITNAAGAPSTGFLFKLYRPNNNEVNYLTSFWDVDYFSGILKFQPGKTPGDSGNGLGFVTPALSPTNTTDLPTLQTFLDSNGPHAIAFQYTGQLLDNFLLNIPTGGGGGSGGGSNEWQSSVNGQLIHIGNNQTINSQTDINDQISYLNDKYLNYFIITDDDISGVTWSGVTATGSYYEFNGSTFSPYTLSDEDDENRFLLTENTLVLDVVDISPTGSVTEFPQTTVQPNNIIEYTATASTGLSYSAWQVTEPRLSMVTTLDNKESTIVRYVGQGTGWVEYQYENTYKVNSQKDLEVYTTTDDYDIAMSETVQFEPSGSKSIDVLVNGVEMPGNTYIFGEQGATTSMTVTDDSLNTISVPNAEAPTVGQYLLLSSVSGDYHRQVTAINAGATATDITYGGESVSGVTDAVKFSIAQRSNRVARKGDFLLWIGSSWYELSGSSPKDLITLEYVTMNSYASQV